MFIKKTLLAAALPLAVVATAAVALPTAASAQSYGHSQGRGPAYHQSDRGWTPISQRKFELDRRIDQGLRSGSLNRRDAHSLRADLNELVRLESQYRRGGLNMRERNDLDRRYDRLEARVRYETRGGQSRRHR